MNEQELLHYHLVDEEGLARAKELQKLPGWRDLRLVSILVVTGEVNADPKLGPRETMNLFLRERNIREIGDAEQTTNLHVATTCPKR